jgi:hypothetical protein
VATAAGGGWVEIGDGAALWLMGDGPLALRVGYGEFGALVAGGSAALDERAGLRSTVLVLPEGDGAGASALLAAAAPALTVAYGDATVTGPGDVRYPATSGRIHIWTDGIRWWVE